GAVPGAGLADGGAAAGVGSGGVGRGRLRVGGGAVGGRTARVAGRRAAAATRTAAAPRPTLTARAAAVDGRRGGGAEAHAVAQMVVALLDVVGVRDAVAVVRLAAARSLVDGVASLGDLVTGLRIVGVARARHAGRGDQQSERERAVKGRMQHDVARRSGAGGRSETASR